MHSNIIDPSLLVEKIEQIPKLEENVIKKLQSSRVTPITEKTEIEEWHHNFKNGVKSPGHHRQG
jgi:hypothetical protein